jgi:RNA polymerase sigma factor (TIGR02999 family)
MSAPPLPQSVTQLLQAWCRGDEAALDTLIPLVYDELRRLAHCYMLREPPGHPLQTTALVHEAYIRLIDASQIEWKNRAHFFGVSARLMRRILVDSARSRRYRKRRPRTGTVRVDVDSGQIPQAKPGVDIVALDDALTALSAFAPRGAQVVELRFFGGLTVEETAEVLKVSSKTVKRDWAVAKAWLLEAMKPGEGQ